MGVLARASCAAALAVSLAACGGSGDDTPALLFVDLIYLDDCGCPFENVDLSQGATAGALVEDAVTFETLSETCAQLPASADNSLFDIEPLLIDRTAFFENVDFVDVFVTVFSPPLSGGEACSELLDSANLFGETLDVELSGDDQLVRVQMSCAGRNLLCL